MGNTRNRNDDPEVSVTPEEATKAGFHGGKSLSLSALNDGGLTFEEIANIIERNADKI